MTSTVNDARNQALVLPLTDADYAIAQQLAAQQPTTQKVEQVRLNTLAVSAVQTYLQMMEIPTDIEASESRSPFLSLCNDVADLVVTNVGHLECRPVRPREQTCHIPAEVWNDRIGYVAVEIDEALKEAALVGFIVTVEAEAIPLQQFQPIKALLRRLHDLREPLPEASTFNANLVTLSQWLQGVFETGWQTVEDLLGEPQTRLMPAFRRGDNSERGKLIRLATPEGERAVILIVNHEIEAEASSLSDPQQVGIDLKVISADQQSVLPLGLQLTLLDESGEVFRETEARSEDDYLRLQVNGHPGERFSVRVMLAGSSMTENFVI